MSFFYLHPAHGWILFCQQLYRHLNVIKTKADQGIITHRNGRYRAIYTVPAPSTDTITGTIHINVHYYEDGNVSLNTTKPISISLPVNSSADTVIKRIAAAERAQQLELSDAFSRLSEGAFKGLRRQLPITRQKVEWEKVGGYRLGQDISGGKGR